MIDAALAGDRELAARLAAMPAAVHAALLAKVGALTLKLEALVKDVKLSGGVLNVKTGALRGSIVGTVGDRGIAITGKVASSGDVGYAAINEYGGRTAPHDIVPTKAQALAFMLGGKQVLAKIVHHPGSAMPERSYLRSSLKEMAPEIVAGLKEAALAATRGTAP